MARSDGTGSSKVPLHDTDGRVIGILGTYDDITELKRAEEAVRESERRLRTLAEASFEGICVSENGRILDVNDQFAAMFGYERNELIGREIYPLDCTRMACGRRRTGPLRRRKNGLNINVCTKTEASSNARRKSETLFWTAARCACPPCAI